jgi:UDP-glucose 4-epimerase
MKILILGSEGFIGRSCVKHFLLKGWEVYGCDLLDYSSALYNYIKVSRLQPAFDEVFDMAAYDACINASGNGSVPVSISHPVTDFEANCSDVINILDHIRLKNKECKYIHISSAAIYGNPLQLPINENAPCAPLSPYGWHKLIAETLCAEYYQLYKLPVVIVRPFSIYGPGLHKQLFWDLYQKCKASPDELTLWGTGHESRDFIYIDDVVAALDIIIEKSSMQANIYNLASGIETTIAEAAGQFLAHYNGSIPLKFNNQQRIGDPINWQADIEKLQALGYSTKYTFAEGIKQTAQWLKDLR